MSAFAIKRHWRQKSDRRRSVCWIINDDDDDDDDDDNNNVVRRERREAANLASLPVEITFRIWRLLDAATLLTVGCVCRRWFYLDRDATFWKCVVLSCQQNWTSVVGTKRQRRVKWAVDARRSDAPIGSAGCDWKRCFAEQTRVQTAQARARQKQPLPELLLVSSSSSSLSSSTPRVYRCPVFGSGLGSSAKTLIYPMMLDNSSPFVRTGLYPGVLGIGSGVGVRVGPTELNLCAFNHFCRTLLQQWRDFFARSHGFVFVINPRRCEENLANARGLLHALFFHGSQPVSRQPLLVVGLPPPHPEPPHVQALPPLTPLDVVRELQIERLPCAAYNVVFVGRLHQHDWSAAHSALRWLIKQMSEK